MAFTNAYAIGGKENSKKKCKLQQGRYTGVENSLVKWVEYTERRSINARFSYDILRLKADVVAFFEAQPFDTRQLIATLRNGKQHAEYAAINVAKQSNITAYFTRM